MKGDLGVTGLHGTIEGGSSARAGEWGSSLIAGRFPHVGALRAKTERGRHVSERDALNRRTADGKTPLHLAADKGGIGAVEWLLKVGADPRARDDKGDWLASDLAAYRGDLQTVELLFEALKRYPLALEAARASAVRAAAGGGAALELIEWLIEQKASVKAMSSRGATALHTALAAKRASPERIAAVVKLLVANGASVDAPDGWGRTAREYARRLASGAADAALGLESVTSDDEPTARWRKLLPIWGVVADDNIEALRLLKAAGVSLNHPIQILIVRCTTRSNSVRWLQRAIS